MKRTVNKNFLFEFMETEGLNRDGLAKRFKVSRPTISKMLNGIPPKYPKKRKEIADEAATAVNYLFPKVGEDLAA